jgi:hypothetical protein
LVGTMMVGTNMLGTNMLGTKMVGTNMLGTNMLGTNMLGTSMLGTNMLGTNMLDIAQGITAKPPVWQFTTKSSARRLLLFPEALRGHILWACRGNQLCGLLRLLLAY